MNLITKQELDVLMNDLGLKGSARDYLDFEKKGKWAARLLLLTALFHDDAGLTKTDLVYNTFSEEKYSTIKTFNILEESILKLLVKEIKIITNRSQVHKDARRNRIEDLLEVGLLQRDGKKNRVIKISEVGRQIALVTYAMILKANQIELTEVLEYIRTQRLPENSQDIFLKLKLIDTTNNHPSEYAKALGKIIRKSKILRNQAGEDSLKSNIVTKIRDALLQRVLHSDSPMITTNSTVDVDLIPSDWIYRLESFYEDDREFDLLSWLDKTKNHQDEDYDSEPDSRALGISVVAEPGHGKTKWIEQSAIEIWNSQWTEVNRAETSDQLKRNSSILPILIDLRKIDVFPDIDKQFVVKYDSNQPLWPLSGSHIDPPLRKVMAHLLKGSLDLPDSVQDLEPIVRDLEYGKNFILFLDGWDELPSKARNHVTEYVKFFLENGVPTVITSRELNPSLAQIISRSLSLGSLNDDAIVAYAEANGMELTARRIQNIRKWIGVITPLDLRVLTVFPDLDNLPQNRVALYRNWIVFQTIREGCSDGLPPKFRSDNDVKEFIATKKVQIKENILTLSDILYGFPNSASSDNAENYSLMHYVSKVAYLEMIEQNQALDYEIATEQNPLLKGFIDAKWIHDMRPYPQIRKKHLIPYLASEFILREYLSSRYWSVKGNPFTLSFLEEVLEYDRRHIAGQETMTSNQVKLAILLEADSQDNNPTPITNLFQYPQTSYYSSLYHSLVEYWRIAVRVINKRAQNSILQCFNYLIQTNCYIPREIEQNPTEFVSDIYIIERELGEVEPIPDVQTIQSIEFNNLIENRTGQSLGYVSQKQLDILYNELLLLRPWLIPWIIRVASIDVREKVIDHIEKIPNTEFRLSILQHELVENPTNKVGAWIDVLTKIIQQHPSDDLLTLLAYTLRESDLRLSDDTLEIILALLSQNKIAEDHKYSLIVSTDSSSLSRRQKERIRQVLFDAPKLKKKYYFALAAIHDIDNVELESFFSEVEQTQDYKWMALLLRRIARVKQTELVRERFHLLPLGCINIIETQLLKPRTYTRFERGRFRSYQVNYLDDDTTARLHTLCENWWNHYLASVNDAIEILDEVFEPLDAMFDDLDYVHISFDYHRVFERLVAWIQLQDRDSRSQFLMTCLEKKLDITNFTERKILKPLIETLSDNERINLKLVKLYKEYPYFLLDIWGEETWTKYIKLFPRVNLISDDRLFSYFIKAGGLSSIDDAVDAIEINPEIMRYRETTDNLIDWLSSRSIQEQATFVERVLDFDIPLNYLSKIIRKLEPIHEYPLIHSKLIKIANSGRIMPLPSSFRDEPEGHFVPRHEIAYTYLSPQEKMNIINPMIDRLLSTDWSEDEDVNNIIAEYIHIAEKKDLAKVAEFLDRFPTYADAVIIDEGEKLQALLSMIKNPVTKILIDILVPNYKAFVTEVDIDKAKKYLIALTNEESGEPFWGAQLAFSLYRQRKDLQDIVIDIMDQLPIDWNNYPRVIGWLETILTKGHDRHTEFVSAKMDIMELELLIKIYQSMTYGKDETFYLKLLVLLSNLKNTSSIIVTIATAAHLGVKLGVDVNELWEIPQFKGLSSKNRIDIKSGRWFTSNLDNSL